MNLFWGGLMFSSDLAWTHSDRKVRVFCRLLVGSVPVEDVEILLVPEFSVVEHDFGNDGCEDGNESCGNGFHLCLLCSRLRLCSFLPCLVGFWV